MFRRKADAQANRVHWQTDPVQLTQVDIDLSALAAEAGPPPDGGWLESSRDLLRGVRVRETPMDSLPAELIDVFLKRPR